MFLPDICLLVPKMARVTSVKPIQCKSCDFIPLDKILHAAVKKHCFCGIEAFSICHYRPGLSCYEYFAFV